MYSGLHDSCARDIPRMFHMEVTWLFTWLLVFFSLEVEGAETLFASVWRVSSSTHFPILVYVLVRALNRYGRGHGFVSRTSLIFFFFFFFFSGFLFAIAKLASITAIIGGLGSQPTGSQIIWLCIRIYHKINTNVKMQINSYLI